MDVAGRTKEFARWCYHDPWLGSIIYRPDTKWGSG